MRRHLAVLAALTAIALLLGACSATDTSDADDAATTSTLSNGDGTEESNPAVLEFTTSDGLDYQLPIATCESAGESSISLETGETDFADLAIEASGGTGTVALNDASGHREGTVESVQVGDAGDFVVEGSIDPPDDGDVPATFTAEGSCA